MKEVRNTTRRPLRVPLPGGRTLHLGPAQTAEIADNALEHAPVQELIEEGSIEILGEGERHLAGARSEMGRARTHGNPHGIRRSRGDR